MNIYEVQSDEAKYLGVIYIVARDIVECVDIAQRYMFSKTSTTLKVTSIRRIGEAIERIDTTNRMVVFPD